MWNEHVEFQIEGKTYADIRWPRGRWPSAMVGHSEKACNDHIQVLLCCVCSHTRVCLPCLSDSGMHVRCIYTCHQPESLPQHRNKLAATLTLGHHPSLHCCFQPPAPAPVVAGDDWRPHGYLWQSPSPEGQGCCQSLCLRAVHLECWKQWVLQKVGRGQCDHLCIEPPARSAW